MPSLSDPRVLAPLFCLLLAACGTEKESLDAEANQRPVKLITIAGSTASSDTRYPAVISAGQTAELSFPTGGTLIEIAVSESVDVNKGDVIARLEDMIDRIH